MSTGVGRRAIPLLILVGAACFPGPAPSPGPEVGPPAPVSPPTGAPATPPPAGTTAPTPPLIPVTVGLPPIPNVVGPIALRVVYPPAGSLVGTRDSNFVFGSVGSGGATLRINGRPVEVKPNGSFLAFLPVPSTLESAGVYEFEVTQGSDTVRAQHRVTLPPEPLAFPSSGPLIVDSSSLNPRGKPVLERWEPVRVSAVVASAAQAELQLADGARLLMLPAPGTANSARGSVVAATEVPAVRLNSGAWVQVVRGRDSVRLPLGRVALSDSAGPQFARLGAAPSTLPDTDRVITGRPLVGGTYKWFLIPGTVAEVTGQVGSMTRVRLDSGLQIFVDRTEVEPLPVGTPAPRRVAGNARVVHEGGWTDVRIPMSEAPAYSVDAEAQALILTLHGTIANTDIINFTSTDSIVRRVTWRQVQSDRAEFRVELLDAPFGYLVMWDRNALVLRVRGKPTINRIASTAGPHHRGRCRSSTGRDDGTDGSLRSRGDVRHLRTGEGLPRAEGRDGGHDALGARRRGTGGPPGHRAPRQRPRIRVDPPERISGRRESVRAERDGGVLLQCLVGTVRARRAGWHGAPHGPS